MLVPENSKTLLPSISLSPLAVTNRDEVLAPCFFVVPVLFLVAGELAAAGSLSCVSGRACAEAVAGASTEAPTATAVSPTATAFHHVDLRVG